MKKSVLTSLVESPQIVPLIIKEYIKVGDQIKLIDGSGLSLHDSSIDQDVYIVYNYPKLTGSDHTLENILGTVIETNVVDYMILGLGAYYIQDLVIQLGACLFRTSSAFVIKVY